VVCMPDVSTEAIPWLCSWRQCLWCVCQMCQPKQYHGCVAEDNVCGVYARCVNCSIH